MYALLDEMAASDMLVWSFPLYYHGLPAQLKAVLDRTNPFLKLDMKMNGNRVVHEKIVDLSKKKNIMITGCGFPYDPDNFAPLRLQMSNIFEAPAMICVCESTLLTLPVPELAPVKENLLAAFAKAGLELSETGILSKATISTLEKPMLPNELYINMINDLKKHTK